MKKSTARFPRLAAGYAAGGLLVALSLFGLLRLYDPPAGAAVASGALSIGVPGRAAESAGLPFLACATDPGGFEAGTWTFEFGIDVRRGDFPEGAALVFPFIAGQSLSVSFNGRALGSRGDPVRGDSSIWNAAHVFVLPRDLVAERNAVRVEILGLYEAGLLQPPYLADPGRCRVRLALLHFFTVGIVWLLVGATAVLGLVIAGIGAVSGSWRDGKILLGVSCVLLVLYLLDFTLLDLIPMPYVVFKRISVSARHLAAVFLTASCVALLGRKYGPVGIALTAVHGACAVLVAAHGGDAASLKRLYSLTYLSIGPFLAYLVFLVGRSVLADKEYRILFFGVAAAFLAASRDVYSMAADWSMPFVSHYGIAILIACAAGFVVRDVLLQYRALEAERRRSAAFLEESVRDQLTGAYNRKILGPLAEGLPEVYSVLFIDLDDFKSVNDAYGHAAGDAVLRRVVECARIHTRSNDAVVRSGGDEFLAVLPECPAGIAAELAGRLVAAVAAARIDAPGGPAGGLRCTVSVGVAEGAGRGGGPQEALDEAVARADAAAYAAKRAGKGRVALDPAGPGGLDTHRPSRIR